MIVMIAEMILGIIINHAAIYYKLLKVQNINEINGDAYQLL